MEEKKNVNKEMPPDGENLPACEKERDDGQNGADDTQAKNRAKESAATARMTENADGANVNTQSAAAGASDPFDGYNAPNACAPARIKKPAPLSASKKVAYSAAATAIASVASIITVFLPVKIMPLVLAAFCFFLVFIKCGAVYGIVAAAATALITFLTGGLNTSLILLCVCFFPYSVLCVFLRRFSYRKVVHALIRAAAAIVLVNIAFVCVYFIAKYAVLNGLDIMAAVGKTGYFIAALIVSAVAVITDFLFVLCDGVITPKIK